MIRLSLYRVVCLLFLLPALRSKAQSLVVQGRVSDVVTDESLRYSTVILDKSKQEVSDSTGFFRIKTLPGKHTLKVVRVGYRNYEITFEYEDFGVKNFKIEMEPFNNSL